jgi:hypothetical protein
MRIAPVMVEARGSEWDPVILPVFKTGARRLRGVEGVFDSHTLPPFSLQLRNERLEHWLLILFLEKQPFETELQYCDG